MLSQQEYRDGDYLLFFGQVVLKSMMVIHRTLREGDPPFWDELLNYALIRGLV